MKYVKLPMSNFLWQTSILDFMSPETGLKDIIIAMTGTAERGVQGVQLHPLNLGRGCINSTLHPQPSRVEVRSYLHGLFGQGLLNI